MDNVTFACDVFFVKWCLLFYLYIVFIVIHLKIKKMINILILIMALQTPHISYSKLGKMSKCAENFLKSREQIKTELDREEKLLKEAKFDLDLDKIVSGIGNGKSPCISSKNVQEIYKNCRNIVFEEFQQNKSILIDFSNGRLGNQMSSFASTFALSRQLNLKQIMTHHRHTMLSKYFQLSKEPGILESHFCSPCKDLQFLPVSSAADHLGQVLVIVPHTHGAGGELEDLL